jgi:hypothetical protein
VSLLPCITKSARGCACRERAAKETAEQEAAEEPETAEQEASRGPKHTSMRGKYTKHMPECMVGGCKKLAVRDRENQYKFCVAHGGGLRCLFQGCGTAAQTGAGLGEYCNAHGPRCSVDGCTNGAKAFGRCTKHR